MYIIDKEFAFCYGHRVHSQVLDRPDLSVTTDCKCRHLHGHQGKVQVFLEAPQLERGMVTDFRNLSWLKVFIDDYLDHKFIIDSHDPLFDLLTGGCSRDRLFLRRGGDTLGGLYVGDVLTGTGKKQPGNGALQELFDGMFIVNFLPTSENLAAWLYRIVEFKMSGVAAVAKVDWWETPKSRASFSAGTPAGPIPRETCYGGSTKIWSELGGDAMATAQMGPRLPDLE